MGRRSALLLTSLLAAATLAACAASRGERPAPNLLLVVVDCLRADHLGAYGYERPTSPNLDGLASSGVLFEHASSPAFWTRPAVPSLLTGLYPSEHGLLEWEKDARGQIVGPALSPRVETVAERLREAGYATALIAEQYQLSRRFGLGQGFDHYHNQAGTAPNLNRAVGRWLDAARPARFFLYLHYLDVHWPYCPPRELRGRFDPGKGDIDFCRDWRRLRQRILDGSLRLDADDRDTLVARYDEEVLGMDYWLGQLFADLQRRGLWAETLVVVTADHGEEFLEHGKIGHENDLWQEALHVPLIVKPPAVWRAAPRRVAELVETRQIAPTLLDAGGAGEGEESLVPWLLGRRGPRRDFVVAESRHAVAVRAADLKLLAARDGSPPALYDLAADPGEHRDVAAERPEDVARLRALLTAWRRDLEPVPPERRSLDAETRRGLEALGYLER